MIPPLWLRIGIYRLLSQRCCVVCHGGSWGTCMPAASQHDGAGTSASWQKGWGAATGWLCGVRCSRASPS